MPEQSHRTTRRPLSMRSAARSCLAFVAASQLALSGCSTPQRLPAVPSHLAPRADTGIGPVRFLVARSPEEFTREARASIIKEKAYLASVGHSGPLPAMAILAVSGGGDNGAFGAGLLNGWTATGTRPEFKAVTGVSTGALIAPFAFLGSKYDSVLKEVFTTTGPADIFRRRGPLRALFGDSLADTAPLHALISRHIDRSLLSEIAAEYAKGRLLLVATTNLDSLEPVVWNMTAIAASPDPRAPVLFRKILLASAAIPGAFPPVMIDVSVDGSNFQEMHVDGGAMSQVFMYPPSLHLADLAAGLGIERKRSLYIIRNARLDAEWADVRRRVLPISARAIGSLTQTQGVGDLYRIFMTATRDGFDFSLAYIPPTFDVPHREDFDTHYMQQLFDTGQRMAIQGYPWESTPPGFDRAFRSEGN